MKWAHPSNERDRGAALITVLSMLAIMAALAVVVVDAADMSMRRAANQLAMEQTRWYLMGAESFAAAQLSDLRRRAESQRIDQSDWQGRIFEFPLDDGLMRVSLRDGSNCFNLNSVVQSNEGAGVTVSSAGVLQFALLLDRLDVRTDRVALGATLADWIDADSVPSPGGAEDGLYNGAPYRPANTLLADISELRRVKGFDDEIIGRLAGVACARPTTAPNRLNPNTLSLEQAPLLAMALPDITLEQARRIIRDRPRGGWEDVDAFFAHPLLAGLEFNEVRRASFSMQGDYYVMWAQVEREGGRESAAALLRLQGETGVVVRRVFGARAAERAL
ncbi:MAG: type II secretion system minor pseudopilin GspK [Hyphomonadaceae bacterium]